jgi:hypothetical protein
VAFLRMSPFSVQGAVLKALINYQYRGIIAEQSKKYFMNEPKGKISHLFFLNSHRKKYRVS